MIVHLKVVHKKRHSKYLAAELHGKNDLYVSKHTTITLMLSELINVLTKYTG